IDPIPIMVYFGGSEFSTPQIIDYRTTEYTIDEQRTLTSYSFLNLGRLQFLTRMPLAEGDRAGQVQLRDFSAVDTKRFLTDENLTETRQRLANRSGCAKDELLAQIEQRAVKPVKKKQVQAPKEPARLENTHDTTDHLPVTPKPTTPVPPARRQPGATRELDDEPIFQ
ncbi:MAG TPA: hypothetical protein PKE45_01910, partial [Caldilineaceae bacterium]|nr:hypothetical protein [Caldilineaceae bacterium]